MQEPAKDAPRTAGIIGGGTGGSGLLAFLLTSQKIKVVFIVDRNPEAPGLRMAAKAGIQVFTDLEEALRNVPCQLLFEMTGVPAVKEQVTRMAQAAGIELMPAATWMLIQDMEASKQETSEQVTREIRTIKAHLVNSLEGSQDIVGRINQVMSAMQMLALNASIEAAKVGVHGRGFAVVANHLGQSVENVRKLTGDIGKVNAEIRMVSEQIDGALVRLEQPVAGVSARMGA